MKGLGILAIIIGIVLLSTGILFTLAVQDAGISSAELSFVSDLEKATNAADYLEPGEQLVYFLTVNHVAITAVGALLLVGGIALIVIAKKRRA